MKFSNEQIKTLLGFVAKTADHEISCQTCEERLSQFAESMHAGNDHDDSLRVIEDHLKICPECSEELEFLRRALEAEGS